VLTALGLDADPAVHLRELAAALVGAADMQFLMAAGAASARSR
jgi:hypothetical protein